MKFKGDGYESEICEHHRDIVTCPDCDIFKDGYEVRFKGQWWDVVLHPIQHWRLRHNIKSVVRSKHE